MFMRWQDEEPITDRELASLNDVLTRRFGHTVFATRDTDSTAIEISMPIGTNECNKLDVEYHISGFCAGFFSCYRR